MPRLIVFALFLCVGMITNAQVVSYLNDGIPTADIPFGDQFGKSISIDGNYALIGVPGSDDPISNSGKAFIYKKQNGGWTKKKEFSTNQPFTDFYFGLSVCLSGPLAFVGVPGFDNGGDQKGVVYVYKSTSAWETYAEIAVLTHTDLVDNSLFGTSIAAKGNFVAIGAPGANGASNNGSGAVYIFELVGPNFVFRKKIFTSIGNSLDDFGYAVAFNNDNLFVGSPLYRVDGRNEGSVFVYDLIGFNQVAQLKMSDDIHFQFGASLSATNNELSVAAPFGLNGNGSFGSVFLFIKSGPNWVDATENFKFLPLEEDGYGLYGSSISMNESFLLVGTKSGTKVDLLQKSGEGWGMASIVKTFEEPGLVFQNQYGTAVALSDNDILIGAFNLNLPQEASGSVFAYENDGTWATPKALPKLYYPSPSAGDDLFGEDVDIYGKYAVVGARNDDARGENSGAAYVYEFNGMGWDRVAKLTASNAEAMDNFGSAVSITDDRVVVSATSAAFNGANRGVVYVFEKPANGWEDATETAVITRVDEVLNGSFGFKVEAAGSEIAVTHYQNGSTDKIGECYVFGRVNDSWVLKARLNPVERTSVKADAFGFALAFDGSTVVVGSYNAGSQRGGLVHVFQKPINGWVDSNQGVILSPSDPVDFGGCGYSVGIYKNTIIAGCPQGSNGTIGAAYIFERGNKWKNTTENAKLRTSITTRNRVGTSVDIWGDIAVVSSPKVGGEVFLYKKEDNFWRNTNEYNVIFPNGVSESFGQSLALMGDHLIVGAPESNSESGGKTGKVEFFLKQATIIKVDSSTPDGTYGVGENVNIKVYFSHPVKLSGSPRVELLMYDESTRLAAFNQMISDTEADFTYKVEQNDSTIHLNYKNELSLKGSYTIESKIKPIVGLRALPSPESEYSLAGQKNIIIAGIFNKREVEEEEEEEVTVGVYPEVEKLIIYPNPFNNELVLNGDEILGYHLINSNGGIVSAASCDNCRIDTSILSSGLYVLNVKTISGWRRSKLFKK